MIDKPLFASIIVLFTISLMMSYSLSTFTVLYFDFNSLHFFARQLFAVAIGIGIMVFLSKRDPDIWFSKIGFVLFIVSLIAMMAMPFLPESITKSVLGAKRWIKIGPASITPTEYFKVGFIFFLAWSLSRKMPSSHKLSLLAEMRIILPHISIFIIAVLLISIFQKDLGQAVILALIFLILLLFAGRSFKLFFFNISMGLIGFIVLIFVAPHRMARIKSWWSTVQDNFLYYLPDSIAEELKVDVTAKPYQISNALHAIHNGGLWGQGLGNSQFKLGYLSEVHTDFVLAGMGEELGFIGIFTVALLMIIILFRILKIASRVENFTYHLFSIGIGLSIILAFLINSYGVSGMIPIKGIAVPFLSYGGSHIIASSIGIGMVLMISKKRNIKQ